MYFNRSDLNDTQLLSFYRTLVYPRLIEEKMLLLLRQGKISKWFSGIGQEAIAVGATLALEPDEWIMPLHRNLGVFTTRHMPLDKLLLQWQGSEHGYSQGRERSFHFGSRAHHICGMISHLGPQLSIADGIALAHKLRKEEKVALAFTGEGGTSEGEFHEALNVAAVWDLPVIFLIENNGYGLSTPVSEQYRCNNLTERAAGYGMKGIQIDGNNLLEVFLAIREARSYAITEQKPVLIEAMTFRMRGHEEASGVKYVPPELFEIWGKKDPVVQFENYLQEIKLLTENDIKSIREDLKRQIEADVAKGLTDTPFEADTHKELNDLYAPAPAPVAPAGGSTEKRFINALSDGLKQAMEQHPELILMGQDIAGYGGAFKITEGFMEQFGADRVRNTPLCESAIVGTALGLSLAGFKSMVEMQFGDFVTCGFNQIVNNLAKIHYRWGQPADVVIRMPSGGGVGAGPFHSQSNEAWFTHVPGLKVVYPATPEDAKGLLTAALADPNPVMYFEHKALYRSISSPVPDAYYTVEIGKARLVQAGDDISIITYGSGVHWAMEYAAQHPEISIGILDLRTLLPLDYTAIQEIVAATGKVLVLHEDTLIGGFGAEISAWIAEHCFSLLDAPVLRCASLDTPVPFAPVLEKNFLAKSRLDKYVQQLMHW
ncbi:alpha-ketoacid dehydrogenase subunit alpha/beta [Chitinophaga nivalis]|uniref:Dehydrogenase E1 component subunit alpha/beta n=1 Tax=Chitinophaga nivalis TaxID=2991709 RepID=A0ABT3IVF8_9BACT|nr:dehydrogenase E1 component subunit alpha/beta [Chitinophaga nivalis]MCW3462359.1 dehydrogenase E1 component subunit alpha/beta [Chitinophaga nivalis]MCW3487950.1 dehydrogenase E1 component subunit alpha/beta [Chitinophaga nivalis]